MMSQRLHQPYRPLQPSQHLHRSRSCCTRFLDLPVPDQRLLAGACAQSTIARIQRKEVSLGQHPERMKILMMAQDHREPAPLRRY
jgi:hypothetical protein